MAGADAAGNGIPPGLNRIRTRPLPSTSELLLGPPPRADRRRGGSANNRFYKGKRFARWLTSHFDKHLVAGASEADSTDGERSCQHKNGQMENICLEGKDGWNEFANVRRKPMGIKSFSHELGSKGRTQPVHPRAHSYDDLKELVRSLHSKFDSAKEAVNGELGSFAKDVLERLEKLGEFNVKSQRMAEDLLLLAYECSEMTSCEFRLRCEGIVQNLADKRSQCEAGLPKQLLTRILFILTRCTRLLQFQRDSEPIDEVSLHKFKRCLESVPTVELNQTPKANGSVYNNQDDLEDTCLVSSEAAFFPANRAQLKSDHKVGKVSTISGYDGRATTYSAVSDDNSVKESQNHNLQVVHFHYDQLGATFCSSSREHSSKSFQPQENSSHIFDSVICRICEEFVPKHNLDSHSYICAYANKCDMKGWDIDDRLCKLGEVLEQIADSYMLNFQPSDGNPSHSNVDTSNNAVGAKCYSPKIELHCRGMEGMFEDIHEMDTACLDDSHLSNNNGVLTHFAMKLGHSIAPSSSGSFTSASSTNTPKASHFDLFWIEHNNPSERENVKQIADLADIARCVAHTDPRSKVTSEYIRACMHDLLDILCHSKLKALVIDTFGGRLEALIREKYFLACEERYKDPSKQIGNGLFVHDDIESTLSTPLHPAYKERTGINDFEIIKPISKGAYGKVFLARKRTTGDLFAIKVLKKLDMIRKNDIERILAERNILITVRNPFVVRFFYSFTCRENMYLVMEYLNGGDLYSLLRKVGCLDEPVARIYIAELVLALEYLHSLGIVHRDLKPDNILIAHDGHTKLTDFGLSKIGLINSTIDLSGSNAYGKTILDAHEHTFHGSESSQQSAVGTPDYLAPEILLGTEHGYAADWWSVGIILFELITGIPPFTAQLPEMIFDNILNQEIPWPDIPNDMSIEAQDLIKRFLIHDPCHRLGANGASEVKAHSFFEGINWDTLALHKAAFIPNPESLEDTSYFLSRYSQSFGEMPEEKRSSHSSSYASDVSSNLDLEADTDECIVLNEFDGSPLDLSFVNFSFKNLSQLALINHDVLQTGKKIVSAPHANQNM